MRNNTNGDPYIGEKEFDEIRSLFEDAAYFASLSADIDISKFLFNSVDYFKYPLGSDLLYSDIEQFENIKQAFAALFIKWLYDANEWTKPATDDITKERWEQALKEYWILDTFYQTKYVKLKLEPIDVKRFLRDLNSYQVEGGASEKDSKVIIDKFVDAKVIVINETTTTKMLFGMTEKLVFLCEYGCYD